ncbi:flagellar biosynthesis anti-sigma factor FlgM [Porticoccaceae bacterium]|nr:flagellar biosynthesis anti-sigma factor FlgM [Porticoccaceae bacterium]
MTDGISKLGRSAVEVNSTADKYKNKVANEASTEKPSVEKFAPANDEVILSKTAVSALETSDFDEAKVAKIKQAIADGQYPLNERRIAESFVAIERMLGGN